MKNKKLTYILVPLVILIWGLIVYKVISGIKEDGPLDKVYQTLALDNRKETIDTFVLKTNYEDPFLKEKNHYRGHTAINQPKNKQQSVPNASVIPINYEVQYFGIISNLKNKNKLGLIKIQGKDFLIKEGDLSLNNLKIYKIYKDSVIVISKNFKHTIKRT